MNNSLAIEKVRLSNESADAEPALRERESKLIKILTALDGITKEWSSLKEEVFDGLREQLKKDLFSEAKRENPDPVKLSRIAGKLEIAEQYDLEKLQNRYRLELNNVKKQLNGTKD